MNHQFQQIVARLKEIYPENEAGAIAEIVFTDLLGIKKTNIYLSGGYELSYEQDNILSSALTRLLQYEPVQHVVGWTTFLDCKIICNRDVLIPRPETEELVLLLQKENNLKIPKILDIGTGSGCIAIALKKGIPEASVFAIDVSDKALDVARRNAAINEVEINFLQADILKASGTLFPRHSFDYIISNPPYVLESQKKDMKRNVLDFDPELALFVPDQKPLLFYGAIADFGIDYLKNRGRLYLEINELKGETTIAILFEKGYKNPRLINDLYGKSRMVVAEK